MSDERLERLENQIAGLTATLAKQQGLIERQTAALEALTQALQRGVGVQATPAPKPAKKALGRKAQQALEHLQANPDDVNKSTRELADDVTLPSGKTSRNTWAQAIRAFKDAN